MMTNDFENLSLLGTEQNLIIVITKNGCKGCEILKDKMNQNNVEFLEIPYESLQKNFKQSIFNMRKSNGINRITFPLVIVSKENLFFYKS